MRSGFGGPGVWRFGGSGVLGDGGSRVRGSGSTGSEIAWFGARVVQVLEGSGVGGSGARKA